MILTRQAVNDDEDEGSLPQSRANPGETCREKIECSADALRGRHNPRKLSLQV